MFTIGGVVSGLAGAGLVLQLNGSGNLNVVSNGAFAFETGAANGTAYKASVLRQPRNPMQSCIVSNAEGSVTGANVTVANQPRNPEQRCDVRRGSGAVQNSDVGKVEVRCRGEDDDDDD